MNGYQYLMGAVYCTRCSFGSVKGFSALLEPDFANLPFEGSAVLARLDSLLSSWEHIDEDIDIDIDKAKRLCVAQDLRAVRMTLVAKSVSNPELTLPNHLSRYASALRDLGLRFSDPQLFIVDVFPKPYDTMDWTATSPDRADQRDYGIEPGNYFKRKHLIPYRSDLLLAHEMIHHIIGEVDPDWLGRGLEEGLAVILGELFLGSRVVGTELAKNYTIYHWLDFGATQLKQTYTEYARQAAAIYRRHGLEGILSLVRSGRPKIKEVEKACLAGEWEQIDLPSGQWDDTYSAVLDSVTMGFIRHLVVSPLAHYVSRFVSTGSTVKRIAEESGVGFEGVRQALDELQHNTFLVMVNADRVDYSDVEMVSSVGALRYGV
jgi:hypothetical protein